MDLRELEAACGRPPLSFLEVPFWLVGGCVRDVLLARPVLDWDILVEHDAPGVARRLADRWGGSFVPLDEERSIARVVGPERLVVDVCEIGAGTLEDDLRRRDFTVNAMAFSGHRLMDPLEGRRDLRRGVLRVCSERSLPEDPLRVLRAFRFLVELGFTPGEGLEEQLRQHSQGLGKVARERIRDEFFRILRAGLTAVVGLMQRCGALQVLPPFADREALAALEGSVPPPWLEAHLTQSVAGGRRRRELLRLASLYSPGAAQSLTRALCLGRQEEVYLSRVLRTSPGPLPPPLRYELYRELKDCLPDYAWLLACTGRTPTDLWLQEWHERSRLVFPPRYLNGNDLRALGFPSDPSLGCALDQLERASALGEVTDRQQALEFARRQLEARETRRRWKK